MQRCLVIRAMATVYIHHKLVLRREKAPEYSIQDREVYLSNISDLDTVLALLKDLMLSQKPQFLFCLNWDGVSYYFNRKGQYTTSLEPPKSDLDGVINKE